MKKLIKTLSIFILVIYCLILVPELLYPNETKNKTGDDPNYLTITIYQQFGSGVQQGVEVVVYNANQTQIYSGTTNSLGRFIILNFNQPIGYYTIKAWYPPRSNDQQYAELTFIFVGNPTDKNLNLGPVY